MPPLALNARVAQWIEHKTSNLGVVGSSPIMGDLFAQVEGGREERRGVNFILE